MLCRESRRLICNTGTVLLTTPTGKIKAIPLSNSKDTQVQRLAARPGLNSSNTDRQRTAQALVQLLSLLTSVQNSRTQPAVFQQRPEECTGCGETKAADKIARVLLRHRAERSAAMPMYTGTVMSRGPVVGGR